MACNIRGRYVVDGAAVADQLFRICALLRLLLLLVLLLMFLLLLLLLLLLLCI